MGLKEVLDLCDQRRQQKQQKYTSTEAGPEYRNVNREVRKKMRAAKEERTEEQRKYIQKGMKSETARRPITPSRLSSKPNSVRQQSSKTTVETA